MSRGLAGDISVIGRAQWTRAGWRVKHSSMDIPAGQSNLRIARTASRARYITHRLYLRAQHAATVPSRGAPMQMLFAPPNDELYLLVGGYSGVHCCTCTSSELACARATGLELMWLACVGPAGRSGEKSMRFIETRSDSGRRRARRASGTAGCRVFFSALPGMLICLFGCYSLLICVNLLYNEKFVARPRNFDFLKT